MLPMGGVLSLTISSTLRLCFLSSYKPARLGTIFSSSLLIGYSSHPSHHLARLLPSFLPPSSPRPLTYPSGPTSETPKHKPLGLLLASGLVSSTLSLPTGGECTPTGSRQPLLSCFRCATAAQHWLVAVSIL